MNHFDTIVIGLGAMGISTCYQLAKRGVKVLGLEQFDIPNHLGSSHGESRIIRMAYYEHADYVPLLKRSYELWDALEHETQRRLWHRTGVLYMGEPGSEVVHRSIDSAVKHAIPHEVLDHAALAARFPQFVLPEQFTGLFEPSGGVLLPEKIVAAFAEAAMLHGAVLHGREAVTDWDADGSRATIRTPRATYSCDHLIFCGGPWTTNLLRTLGVELTVTRQIMGWVWPSEVEPFQLGRLPGWVIDHGSAGFYYGFPMLPDCPGLKLARHDRGRAFDSANLDRSPVPEDEDDFRPALAKFLPKANGPLLSMKVCLYTRSPDSHFIIDRHPLHPNVSLACGFSGHGFKFASVVGEALADLAVDGQTQLPIDFLSVRRFAKS